MDNKIDDIQVGQAWTHTTILQEVYETAHLFTIILITGFNGVTYSLLAMEGKKTERGDSFPKLGVFDYPKNDLSTLLTAGDYRQNDLGFLVKYGSPIEVITQAIKKCFQEAVEEVQKFDSWLGLVNRTGGLK